MTIEEILKSEKNQKAIKLAETFLIDKLTDYLLEMQGKAIQDIFLKQSEPAMCVGEATDRLIKYLEKYNA